MFTLIACVGEDIMYNDLLLNRIGATPMDDPDEHVQELIEEIEELIHQYSRKQCN